LLRLFSLLLLLLAAGCAGAPEPAGAAARQKRIAITFDDAPRAPGAFFTPDERARRLIAGLNSAGVRQAAFFVNPGHLEKPFGAGGEARLAAYVAAGHVLANHSFSHPQLTAVAAEEYLADIDRAEKWLKGREGRRPWFRFPFLNEGRQDKAKRDAVRAGLAARRLRNGYATIDSSDWNIDALTTRALREGKTVHRTALRDLYVESHVEAADFYDDLARRTLGRSPAHVLVLHETDLAALYVADLVAALRLDGWNIVTADEAYADPIATALPDTPSAQGTLTELLAWEKGLPAPRWYERNDLKLANALFAERVLGEKPAEPTRP
jgi:peptidoglycan/xylan/chitin deacetylase (PgdA/CDA1 family)